MASCDSALTFFDSNGFRDHPADRVAIPSTSQDPGHEADVQRYLADAIQPWLERMGFTVEITPIQSPASARSCSPSGWRDRIGQPS